MIYKALQLNSFILFSDILTNAEPMGLLNSTFMSLISFLFKSFSTESAYSIIESLINGNIFSGFPVLNLLNIGMSISPFIIALLGKPIT